MDMEKDTFYVYWLLFKDGYKQLCPCIYHSRSMAEHSALKVLSYHRDLDLLDDEHPFYVACYEY